MVKKNQKRIPASRKRLNIASTLRKFECTRPAWSTWKCFPTCSAGTRTRTRNGDRTQRPDLVACVSWRVSLHRRAFACCVPALLADVPWQPQPPHRDDPGCAAPKASALERHSALAVDAVAIKTARTRGTRIIAPRYAFTSWMLPIRKTSLKLVVKSLDRGLFVPK